MATIYDIAKKTGVSTATVSRVLNGVSHPVSEKTRLAILETAKELNYRPNTIAKSLSKGKTNTVAVLLPSITNDFYTQFVDIIEKGISDDGYSTFLCNTHRDIERETRFVNTLIERRVDGVVFCPTRLKAEDNAVNLENVRQLCAHGLPIVVIGSHFEDVSKVYVDTFEGAKTAVRYLISLGHKKIGFIDGLSAGTSRRRFRGYLSALEENGIKFDESFVCSGDLSFESGAKCTASLLDGAGPTAILAVNNMMAAGALSEARRRGVSVPGGLSVIGFDDSPLSGLIYPRLTVIRQPLEKIGESVKRLLCAKLDGSKDCETVRLEAELILRDSCSPPQAGK